MIVRELEWMADAHDSRVRIPRFVRRPPIAAQTMAALADAVARRVAEMFSAAPRIDIFPPVELDEAQWAALTAEANVFERGEVTFVVGPEAARQIVASAFGEITAGVCGPLSALELHVLERFVAELAGGLPPVCSQAAQPRVVYCELRLRGALDARIGVAVRQSIIPQGPRISETALDACPIECWVRLGGVFADFFTIANLAAGDVLRLQTKVGPSATLNLGSGPIAAGEGGVLGDRTAFKVHELI